jgi:hypothetical protein
MIELDLRLNNRSAAGPCPLCDDVADPDVGWTVFLRDLGPSVRHVSGSIVRS